MAGPERLKLRAPAVVWLAALAASTMAHVSIAQQSDADKLAYGKHLSQECTSCHRRDGTDKGIPSIIGLEPDYFVTTMKFYQTGARDNPTMKSVVATLGEEQLQALAAYFLSLKPAPKAKGAARK